MPTAYAIVHQWFQPDQEAQDLRLLLESGETPVIDANGVTFAMLGPSGLGSDVFSTIQDARAAAISETTRGRSQPPSPEDIVFQVIKIEANCPLVAGQRVSIYPKAYCRAQDAWVLDYNP